MQESTRTLLQRKPLRNFIYCPTVQWPLIVFNGMLVLLAIAGTVLSIAAVYVWKYGGRGLFLLSRDSFLPMEQVQLLSILAPALGVCAFVSVSVGVLLAMSTSRRVALPIYKVTRWARLVAKGELNIRLGFRKGDRLDELAGACNQVTRRFAKEWKSLQDVLNREDVPMDVRNRIGELLARYRLEE
jgi:hypothetical protein